MIEVNNDFKLKSKKVRQQDVKVTVGEERHKIKQLVYSFDGALFKTIMKQVEITGDTANQLKDKDINFKYGLYINNAFQYVDLGNFYIKDMEDDKKKEEITVTGYDRMIRFMKTFKQSELQLAYPSTIITLVKRMCKICEVELYSTNFFNSDLVVNEDFFTAQELTYRDVLEKIAQVTLTTAFIKENKLYFCKPSNVVSQQLDKSYISNLVVKEKFGPLNALVLGRGSVEDNVESIDEESITQNGRCEIRFDENEFVQEQREAVIDNMFEQIKGLEYYSYEASDLGVMWLEPCDCIELGDRDGNFYKAYYLKANITLTTGISSDSEAEMPDEADTKYKVTSKAEKKTLKVERLAKKNEGLIQDLIQENTETSETLTKHEQTLEGFTNTVSKIEKEVESVKSTANSSVKKVEVKYALSNSSTEAPATGWSTTAPTWTEGKYMWQKTVTTFADGSVSEASPTCIQGAKGADGTDGKDGKDGVNGEKGDTGASGKDGQTYYTWVKYADSPTTGMSDDPAGKTYIGFAYNKTTSVESTNYSDYSWSLIKGEKGDTGDKGEAGKSGTDGNGIKKIDYYYATTTTQTAPAASGITATTIPQLSETNKYLWRKEVITFTTTTTPQTTIILLAVYGDKGATGEQGETGATGKGIKSVQDQYYLSTSNAKQIGGAWKNTQDEWKEGYYIWTRSFITWTDNTTSYTTPCLADSINKANQVASDTAKNLENNYSTTKETETMIKQESESIRLEVETIEKFTRDITSRRELHLVDTADYAENLVLTLKIYGDTEKWKELVPSTSLIPGLAVAPLGTTIDLIVDSQSRLNPSSTKQVFTIKYGKKLRSLGNVRDELDIINNQVTIIRRIGLNDSGQEYVLQTEQTEELGEIKLPTLKDNTYIYVREYPNLEYFCRYITDNEYIKQFATQKELNTKIAQTNQEIELMAKRKVGKDEIIASINLTPEKAKILAKLIELEGIVTANQNFKILSDGSMEAKNGKFTGGSISLEQDASGRSNAQFDISMKNSSEKCVLTPTYFGLFNDYSQGYAGGYAEMMVGQDYSQLSLYNSLNQFCMIGSNFMELTGTIQANSFENRSCAELKENIKKFEEDALNIIKKTDIYQYNYKTSKKNKKIGLVIGEGFKTPAEVISKEEAVDVYAMTSVSWKAIQELDEKIEKIINVLKKIPILGRIFTKRWMK